MQIKNININYKRCGINGAQTLVFLHGWGQNIQMMESLSKPFASEFDILILDLPGHGLSDEPTYTWTMYDFVDCLHELFGKLNIDNPILIGHSFGGKMSLLYASIYNVKKLVLFGSPFKKEIKKDSLKLKILKKLKKIPGIKKLEGFAKKHIGSADYRDASDIMRKIMVEHVNLDITEEVKKIKCPTLIVWGTLDVAVPIERAYELEKLINDAGLVVYDGCTHYAYLERLNQTINVLWNFFKGES